MLFPRDGQERKVLTVGEERSSSFLSGVHPIAQVPNPHQVPGSYSLISCRPPVPNFSLHRLSFPFLIVLGRRRGTAAGFICQKRRPPEERKGEGDRGKGEMGKGSPIVVTATCTSCEASGFTNTPILHAPLAETPDCGPSAILVTKICG